MEHYRHSVPVSLFLVPLVYNGPVLPRTARTQLWSTSIRPWNQLVTHPTDTLHLTHRYRVGRILPRTLSCRSTIIHLPLNCKRLSLHPSHSLSPVVFPSSFLQPVYVNEEIVDSSSNNQSSALTSVIPPSSPVDFRRTSARQPKRRSLRETSTSSRKRTRTDADFNSNSPAESIMSNNEPLTAPLEQQSAESESREGIHQCQ